ncbi:hypothetical protein [Paenibacillus beijingensis]|uniref:Holin n=1 Tax=Paenibacillus beijingensis TaxID=1126833 RepID=A0A0D5NJN2_9BACL|nr:hypothetical protein [Paenibacillus beijingensis]AJY75118.1 hypothetical protein VN24_11690 [Paenibacillus beijingensis]
MWFAAAITLFAVMIAIAEVPLLVKNGLKKELWVFLITLLLGTGLSIAEGLRLQIPNPLDAAAFVLKPFSKLLSGILK